MAGPIQTLTIVRPKQRLDAWSVRDPGSVPRRDLDPPDQCPIRGVFAPGGRPRLVQALMADMRGNGAAASNRGDLS